MSKPDNTGATCLPPFFALFRTENEVNPLLMMWKEIQSGIHEGYFLNARIIRTYEFTDKLGNDYFNYEVTADGNTFCTTSFYYIKTKLKVKQLKLF